MPLYLIARYHSRAFVNKEIHENLVLQIKQQLLDFGADSLVMNKHGKIYTDIYYSESLHSTAGRHAASSVKR